MKAFYVYLMTNHSRVVLYTGVTNSLVRRVSRHLTCEIKGSTKTYRVNRLVYYERFDQPRDAITLEKGIKGLAARKEERFGRGNEPEVGGFVQDAFSTYASHPEPSEGRHIGCACYANFLCVIKRPLRGPSLHSG
jgi:putative endonuclease